MAPRVSVIVPAYNSAAYTVETVESVLGQTYGDFELLVVDDGSTDGTKEALAPYGGRLRYLYKENGGACSARNLGIRESSGEYVACLDCDDLWLPDKLEYSVEALDAQPEAGFVFTGCFLIDGQGRIIDQVRNLCATEGDVFRNILEGGAVPSPSIVMRRACLDEVGYFDEGIFIPADIDLWWRLARRFPVCRVDEPLAKYRMVSNFTLRNIQLSLDEHLYVLDKQLSAEQGGDAGLRDAVRARFLHMHAMMYRDMGDASNARKTLGRALAECPFSWTVFSHYVLAAAGIRVWNAVAGLKRSVFAGRAGA